LSFDALIEREGVNVRIQVKTQRRQAGRAWQKRFPKPWGVSYVVETQRTRGGVDKKTGKQTRPYRFDDFDILAVCMWASTGRWTDFKYALSTDLLPEKGKPKLIAKLQPIPLKAHTPGTWSDSLSATLKSSAERRNETPRKRHR
jgi:hypothetical protein